MTPADAEAVIEFWKRTEWMGLDERRDTPEGLARTLGVHPDLSFVAEGVDGRLVGAVLGTSDTRSGMLRHLAVDAGARGAGLGSALVDRVLEALAARGIERCMIHVYAENAEALAFWESIGWTRPDDIVYLKRAIGGRSD
jgi:ribosomal protein S18 acetylase RimI-like enzyme